MVEHLARHVVAVHEYVVNGVVESVERVVVVVAVVGTYAYSRYCHFGFVIRVGVVLVAAVYLDSVGGRSVGHLDKAAVYCGHSLPVVVAADGEPCGVVVREAVLRAVNNEPVVWHAYFEQVVSHELVFGVVVVGKVICRCVRVCFAAFLS